MKQLKMASLFDGIGGFPYAASFFGIEPVWASEILPEAVEVTKRHFPNMIHVGDITKLSGELLPPVDIITFGSPCQDLSQANSTRLGLAGERSGLFLEAIRIIKEMRKSTNGKYPRYAIWENVPGCFSSNERRDFKAVLEAFTDTEIPMPESDRWTTAGMVRSDTVDFAWVVYNAADFRLAQRRRRIFAVADFRGTSAGEILLVPKSLCWYPTQSRKAWEKTAAVIRKRPEVADQRSIAAFNGGAAPKSGIAFNENICPTLRAGPGSTMTPHILEILNDQNGIGINGNLAGTIDANYHKGTGMRCGVERDVVLCKGFDGYNASLTGDVSSTLGVNCGMSTGRNGVVEILNDQGGNSLNVEKDGKAPTLRSQTHGNLPIICAATVQPNAEICENLCPTITRAAGESGNNKPYVVHPKISGTLCASASGLSRPGGQASETDLTIAYCLQGNMIGRDDRNGPAGRGINEEICFTLNTTDKHAIAKTFGSTSYSNFDESTATLKASGGSYGGGSENLVVPPPPPYVVRRLTPTECERLMGFPDDWTKYGQDGKQISDSKRYSMLGNSVAVPCVVYIMQGIINQINKEEHEIGS